MVRAFVPFPALLLAVFAYSGEFPAGTPLPDLIRIDAATFLAAVAFWQFRG